MENAQNLNMVTGKAIADHIGVLGENHFARPQEATNAARSGK